MKRKNKSDENELSSQESNDTLKWGFDLNCLIKNNLE